MPSAPTTLAASGPHQAKMPPKSTHRCPECSYEARDSYILKRHWGKHLKCAPCRRTFDTASEASRHKADCTKFVEHSLNCALHCALCSVTCSSTTEMEQHLEQQHMIPVRKETLEFRNENDFDAWKQSVETSEKSYFVTGTTNVHGTKKSKYLYCHRSGKQDNRSKSDEARLRKFKKLGSNKINAFCPARMRATLHDDGKVTVRYVSTHVGHDFEPRRLTSKKLTEIAARITKIPLEQILNSGTCSCFRSPNKRPICKHKRKMILEIGLKANGDGHIELEDQGIALHEAEDQEIAQYETVGLSSEVEAPTLVELQCQRAPSKEELRDMICEIIDSADNDDQLNIIYEQFERIKALLQAAAPKPLDSEELTPLLEENEAHRDFHQGFQEE